MIKSIPLFSPLFRGISKEDGCNLMASLGAVVRSVRKGDAVLSTGMPKRNIGVLIDGRLEMYEIDAEGRRSMVGVVRPPQSFAQVFAFAEVERHPATVVAAEDSQVLVIPIAHVLPTPGSEIDAVHRRFIRNLLSDICEQAWKLRSRAYILSRRTTADRLLTYLRQQMNVQGATTFTIPYDRQGLADFLCVDRSALSTVMGRLAARGLLDYRKNRFTLKGAAARIGDGEA